MFHELLLAQQRSERGKLYSSMWLLCAGTVSILVVTFVNDSGLAPKQIREDKSQNRRTIAQCDPIH